MSDDGWSARFSSRAAVGFTFASCGLTASSRAGDAAVRGFAAFCATATGVHHAATITAAATGSEAARANRRTQAARSSIRFDFESCSGIFSSPS
jgi:hypothetical protein